MEFRIHNGDSEDEHIIADSIIVQGETIEEIKKTAKKEVEKRGWKNCCSDKVSRPR